MDGDTTATDPQPTKCTYCGSTVQPGFPFCTVCQSPLEVPRESPAESTAESPAAAPPAPAYPAPTPSPTQVPVAGSRAPSAPAPPPIGRRGSVTETYRAPPKSRWGKGAHTMAPGGKIVVTLGIVGFLTLVWVGLDFFPRGRILAGVALLPAAVVMLLWVWRSD